MSNSNPPIDNSSPQPSGSSSPETYQTKRVRNNLAVKKCREAKRLQEKEMLDAVNKQKALNKQLEDEYEKARMEEQMLRAMLPFCTQTRSSTSSSSSTTTTTTTTTRISNNISQSQETNNTNSDLNLVLPPPPSSSSQRNNLHVTLPGNSNSPNHSSAFHRPNLQK